MGNDLEIEMYMHCGLCLNELPTGESPETYARLAVGWTVNGFQVWCNRHNCNVFNIDLEGHKHPADTTRARPVVTKLSQKTAN